MKIIIYVHCLTYGGAERMATHLANHFSDNGFDVTIVTNSEVDYVSYPLRHDVAHVVMNVGGNSETGLSALLNNFSRVRAFRKEVKQHKPDYVISMAATVNVTSAFSCIGLNVINVGREQSYPVTDRLRKKKWMALRKLSYRWLDAIVAQTEMTAEWLLSNTSVRNVSVVPGAVVLPLDKHEPVVKPDIGNGKKQLLAVGRLAPEKQFDHLIRAFSRACESCPDWQLVILGDGESREELERLIVELEVQDSVFLPGFVGNVGDWYEVSELVALTSAFEGYPNAVIEALAHGVPVVSYDCDAGPREIIEDNVNGILVKPDSEEDFQKGLELMMVDDEKRKAASTSAVRIVERLDIKIVCDLWLDVLWEARARANK